MRRQGLLPLLTALVGLLLPATAQAAGGQDIVRFSTSMGNIDVQLLPQDAPKTVANFLSYVDSGAYGTTFFHRSVPGFIVQGGGFAVTKDSSGNLQVQQIPQQAAVQNEFKDSNVRGTLAMAKLGSDPNSATDQWFFNLADNSSNLDGQNGGFTVFGRVLSPQSLAVMDAVAAQPVVNQGSPFDSLPVIGYTSGTVTASNLIMSPVTRLTDQVPPAITIAQPTSNQHVSQGQSISPQFSCDDGSGTGVETCAASGPLETSTPGQHSFGVTATDYAGNTQTQTVSYTVDEPASPPSSAGPTPAPTTTPTSAGPTPAPTTTPTSPPRAPKPSAPSRIAVTQSLTATRNGVTTLHVLCSGATRCAGVARIVTTGSRVHGGGLTVGSVNYRLAAGSRGTLTFHLGRAALKALRHSARGIPVSVGLLPAAGRPAALSSRITLAR